MICPIVHKLPVVESLQSHVFLTMSHWSSGLPVCFPPQGTQVQLPWGDLCETGILLLAMSRYAVLVRAGIGVTQIPFFW
jgi:hypothetical protein